MDLTDIIYSNDYINILIQNYVAQSERYQMLFPESSALLTLNPQYSVLFLERSLLPENLFGAVPFTGLPKLFTPLSTLSLEVSGIVQTQNLYGGGYTGKNVIFGFLDTGIDYRHPAFLHANGQSRILAVWDQTDRTGTPPAQFPYGSLYTKSDLDAALESGDPLSLVPVTDPDGHGTYVAGVAGGTPDASAGFLGVAPEADFAVVKLKPAKQNLKDFYLVSSNAPVFEEDDLLSAMHFLNETAAAEGKPLVLCLALGTNQGSHSGTLPVSLTLARYGNTPGVIPVCATGNEGNASHHYYGSVSETYTPKNVEFLVSEGNRGFTLELWGQAPQLFSVGFRSPGGETIPQDSRLFESGTADHLRSGAHRDLRQLRSGPGHDRQPAHSDPHAGSDPRYLDASGLPRFSIAAGFPHLAPDHRIFHLRCDISGTGSIHDTDDTFCHGSCSFSLHVSGSKQQFFPGIRPRLYPAW